jgi:hypothetical protein
VERERLTVCEVVVCKIDKRRRAREKRRDTVDDTEGKNENGGRDKDGWGEGEGEDRGE